ncbi:MAG: WYL domain-containing protein [Chloroflexi bacterium]|nr:MAG: WYL domain-containing protein [Chloroflexota bacterium]
MNTKRTRPQATQRPVSFDELNENDVLETSSDVQVINTGPKYETTERVFRLLHLLTANDCSRDDIFERLKDYYKIGDGDDPKVKAPSQRAGRMLRRDLLFLRKMGYQIEEIRTDNVIRYSLVRGTGPGSTFLLNQSELDALVLLHALFADPTKYAQIDATHPLPSQPPRNPFAEEILLLIERLAATLPAEQKKYFDRWARKPYVYFNMDTVTDYLPHRITIDEIVKAVSRRQQIRFEYASLQRQKRLHEHIDPYYIVHQDGHLYLIGYNHGPKNEGFLEFRIDRINTESLKIQPNMIDGERRRRPVEFSYWIDGSIAKSGLSQRWLTHTIEREEVYIDEDGDQRRRVLVRARAYNDWRIIQQMHKYGDKAELVSPPELRERMREEVARMYEYYQK